MTTSLFRFARPGFSLFWYGSVWWLFALEPASCKCSCPSKGSTSESLPLLMFRRIANFLFLISWDKKNLHIFEHAKSSDFYNVSCQSSFVLCVAGNSDYKNEVNNTFGCLISSEYRSPASWYRQTSPPKCPDFVSFPNPHILSRPQMIHENLPRRCGLRHIVVTITLFRTL